MNVFQMIAGTTRRDQWEYHIRNDDIREMMEVESVEEAAWKDNRDGSAMCREWTRLDYYQKGFWT